MSTNYGYEIYEDDECVAIGEGDSLARIYAQGSTLMEQYNVDGEVTIAYFKREYLTDEQIREQL